ncbi:hypothetical protein D3C80_1650730 [compost metagenome]
MPDDGQGEGQQVGGEGLLHLGGAGRQLGSDGVERRQVGGDGELAHGGQRGDQQDEQRGAGHSGNQPEETDGMSVGAGATESPRHRREALRLAQGTLCATVSASSSRSVTARPR